MAEIRIKIEADMSKADEIKILEKLQERFAGTGNYLSELFSVEFTHWASTCISDDMFPEVMQYVKDEAGQQEKSMLREEVRNVTQNLKAAEELLIGCRKELEDRTKQLEGKDVRLDEMHEALRKVRRERDELQSQIVQGANAMCDMENEMVRLKAMLFDLQNQK